MLGRDVGGGRGRDGGRRAVSGSATDWAQIDDDDDDDGQSSTESDWQIEAEFDGERE